MHICAITRMRSNRSVPDPTTVLVKNDRADRKARLKHAKTPKMVEKSGARRRLLLAAAYRNCCMGQRLSRLYPRCAY